MEAEEKERKEERMEMHDVEQDHRMRKIRLKLGVSNQQNTEDFQGTVNTLRYYNGRYTLLYISQNTQNITIKGPNKTIDFE